MTAAPEYIKYDSFIALAMRSGLLSEVHLHCLLEDSEPLDDDLCEEFDTLQHLHTDATSLAAAVPVGPG